ncbi:hypothetical protein EON65_28105 [archaeon]|nr:MAG: hypothetical protein EON65_28105 [archaeon]
MARYNNYNCKGSGYLGSNVIEVSATNGECAAYPPESTATDDGFPETMARYYCETGSEADLMSNYVLSK